jgi:methylated-DNA-[protein]-cysteine S-methyltransferase
MKERYGNQPLAENCFYDRIASPLGGIYLVFLGDSLIQVCFTKPTCRKGTCPGKVKTQFGSYFNGGLRDFSFKIDFFTGTPFERDVWLMLKKVGYGETRSYKWVAEKIGRPTAVRAVGQALKKNPLPIVLPCHRIIESNNSIGGYSSGVDIKRRLLDMEYYFSMSG